MPGRPRQQAARVGIATALTATLLTLPTAHAQASGCDFIASRESHHGVIREYGNSCTYLAVRHRYDPVWSANNYYTAWSGGYGSEYRDREDPELLFLQTQAS